MTEAEVRKSICDIGKRVWEKDMGAANDGNISVKMEDGIIICTPTGVSKGFMTPEMLVKIDYDGNVIEQGVNGLKPSSEIKMHLALYKFRDDVKSVVHAHPIHATAFAVCHIALNKQIMPESTIGLGEVPLAPYATPSTEELPKVLLPYFEDHDTVLMANHGAVSVGVDLTNAYFRMEALEYYAKLLYLAGNIGEVKELSKEEVQTLIYLRETKYCIPGKHPGKKILDRLK